MRAWISGLCMGMMLAAMPALGQTITFPKTIEAGTTISVPSTGSGSATLYIVSPGAAIRKQIELGQSVAFGADDLHNAGHYVVFLAANSGTQRTEFDVVPSAQSATISFLAKPSRLPVNLPDAVSGVAYLFDVFGNMILQPRQVLFELSDSTGRSQSRIATSREGVAWVRMNSAAKAGPAQFQAVVGTVREKRVIEQVAGDPCTLRMSANASGQRIALQTEPVRDCNGNPVPDGTIVTFTETYQGGQSTVDVPLKRGVARTELPAQKGATISVASGVVMGNEIRWTGGL